MTNILARRMVLTAMALVTVRYCLQVMLLRIYSQKGYYSDKTNIGIGIFSPDGGEIVGEFATFSRLITGSTVLRPSKGPYKASTKKKRSMAEFHKENFYNNVVTFVKDSFATHSSRPAGVSRKPRPNWIFRVRNYKGHKNSSKIHKIKIKLNRSIRGRDSPTVNAARPVTHLTDEIVYTGNPSKVKAIQQNFGWFGDSVPNSNRGVEYRTRRTYQVLNSAGFGLNNIGRKAPVKLVYQPADSPTVRRPAVKSSENLKSAKQEFGWNFDNLPETNSLNNAKVRSNMVERPVLVIKTLPNYLQKPATSSNYLKKPATSSNYLQKPAISSNYLQKSATASDYLQKSASTSDYLQKPATILTDYLQNPATTSPNYLQKSAITSDYLQNPATTSPNYLQKPAASSDYLQNLTITSPNNLQNPATTSVRLVYISVPVGDGPKHLEEASSTGNNHIFDWQTSNSSTLARMPDAGNDGWNFVTSKPLLSNFLLTLNWSTNNEPTTATTVDKPKIINACKFKFQNVVVRNLVVNETLYPNVTLNDVEITGFNVSSCVPSTIDNAIIETLTINQSNLLQHFNFNDSIDNGTIDNLEGQNRSSISKRRVEDDNYTSVNAVVSPDGLAHRSIYLNTLNRTGDIKQSAKNQSTIINLMKFTRRTVPVHVATTSFSSGAVSVVSKVGTSSLFGKTETQPTISTSKIWVNDTRKKVSTPLQEEFQTETNSSKTTWPYSEKCHKKMKKAKKPQMSLQESLDLFNLYLLKNLQNKCNESEVDSAGFDTGPIYRWIVLLAAITALVNFNY